MAVIVEFSVDDFLRIAEQHPGSKFISGLSFAECAERVVGKPIRINMNNCFYVECNDAQEAILFKLQWL